MIYIDVSLDANRLMEFLVHSEENLGGFRDVLENLLRDSMDEVVEKAKADAPVRTGRLRDSIRSELGPEELSYIIRADPVDDEGKSYAVFPEFGTSLQEGQFFLTGNLNDVLNDLPDKIRERFKEIFYPAV